MRLPLVEDFLTRLGVTFEYVEAYPIEEIDRVWGRQQQARVNATKLDTKVVGIYLELMRAGEKFNAVVLWDRSTAHVKRLAGPLGGNHRLEAAVRADWKTFPSYVVHTTDTAVVDEIIRRLNSLEAVRGADLDERTAQAKHYVTVRNWTAKNAAKAFGISESKLSAELRADRVRNRLDELHVPHAELSVGTLAAMHTVVRSDPQLETLGRLASDGKLGPEYVSQIVEDMRRMRTDAEAATVVAQWRQRDYIIKLIEEQRQGKRRAKNRTGGGSTVQQRFIAQISRTLKLLERYPTLYDLGITDVELQRATLDKCHDLSKKLEKLHEATLVLT